MKKKLFISLLTVATLLTCGGFTTHKAIEEHPITYDLNGGTFTDEVKDKTVRWLDTVETPTAEKKHYVFKGWTDGNSIMTSIKHARNDVNLTAVYEPEVYTLTFKDGNKEISKSNYAYGNEIKNLSIFSKANSSKHPYENFKTWKDESGKEINKLSETDFGNKILTASYEGKTYKITYDLYDGSADGLPETYQYGKGVDSLPDAEKAGKVFDGWFSDEECTKQVTSIEKDSHSDLHLYAKYHDAPVAVQRTTGSGRTRSYSYSGSSNFGNSSAGNSSSGSYNYSSGATLPRLGYHVNTVGTFDDFDLGADIGSLDSLTYDYWANADESYNSLYLVDGDVSTGLHQQTKTIYQYHDHAFEGLSGLGWKLQAGDKFYVNGRTYTYSGYYTVVRDQLGGLSAEEWLSNGYNLCICTCTEDNTSQYNCFFY